MYEEERWSYMHILLKELEETNPVGYAELQKHWNEGDFSTVTDVEGVIREIHQFYSLD